LKVTILGNGPSLNKVEPPTILTVGINISYLKHWSPWALSMDTDAINRMVKEATPGKFIFPLERAPEELRKHLGNSLESLSLEHCTPGYSSIPKFVKYSGSFAYWYTLTYLEFDEIYLLGFDMDSDIGNFDRGLQILLPIIPGGLLVAGKADSFNYQNHMDSLKEVWKNSGKETKTSIWYKDCWIPIEERWDK